MSPLLQPKISEKAVALAERGQYVFTVPRSANKQTVARAVASQFKVEVAGVNLLISKGKVTHFRRVLGRQSDVKKAIVTLKRGQTIKLFEGAK